MIVFAVTNFVISISNFQKYVCTYVCTLILKLMVINGSSWLCITHIVWLYVASYICILSFCEMSILTVSYSFHIAYRYIAYLEVHCGINYSIEPLLTATNHYSCVESCIGNYIFKLTYRNADTSLQYTAIGIYHFK